MPPGLTGFAGVGVVEHSATSINRLATQATVHCLTGCSIGEVLGRVIATALARHDLPSIVLSIVLAFFFGYALTVRPLLAGGLPLARAARLAIAGVVAWPVNRWLIGRGAGHAVLHGSH